MTKPIVDHMDWRTIFDAKEGFPDDERATLDKYFDAFAQPKITEENGKRSLGGSPCIKCEKPLVGLTTFLLGGGFTWGIAHGEGHCSNCRWPARAHHFIKNDAGDEVLTLRNFPLQYHPDFVEERKRA